MTDATPEPDGEYILPGSIDVVTLGLIFAASGYIADSVLGAHLGFYLMAFGIVVAVLGAAKVVFDMATGFPNQRGLFR